MAIKGAVKKTLRYGILYSPPAVICLSFLLVILFGSILLTLPVATETHVSTPFLDCVFTATSATCVTGLVIYDTAPYWSTFGEVVIISLIQIGGLGFITLATFFLTIARRKAGLRNMMLAQESLNTMNLQETIPLIRQVFSVVFIVEFAGACILSIDFVPRFGPVGFYYGVFHSISSFCNAGFDLMGGNFASMSAYNDTPLVLYTMDLLIIIGGLGFIVWKDLIDYRKNRKLLLHTKIVLIITAVLIVAGSLFIYLAEYDNALSNLPLDQQINASVFLSVNSRTAGFASINPNDLHSITKVFVSMLMFIGGASGSTAGGIKVNTLGIMLIAIICVIRSSDETVVRRRKIPGGIVLKAFSITFLSGILVVLVTFLINLMQPELPLVNVLFESTSGFGTVGLSTGITPSLNSVSKLLIILNMYAGRVGPLSFALVLALLKRGSSNTIYPEGKFVVG